MNKKSLIFLSSILFAYLLLMLYPFAAKAFTDNGFRPVVIKVRFFESYKSFLVPGTRIDLFHLNQKSTSSNDPILENVLILTINENSKKASSATFEEGEFVYLKILIKKEDVQRVLEENTQKNISLRLHTPTELQKPITAETLLERKNN